MEKSEIMKKNGEKWRKKWCNFAYFLPMRRAWSRIKKIVITKKRSNLEEQNYVGLFIFLSIEENEIMKTNGEK
jgi:hypothetical protein